MGKRMGGDFEYDPEFSDHNHLTWACEACGAENSEYDGECQYCECGGLGECKRGNCSALEHFYKGIQLTAMRMYQTRESLRRFADCNPKLAKLFGK